MNLATWRELLRQRKIAPLKVDLDSVGFSIGRRVQRHIQTAIYVSFVLAAVLVVAGVGLRAAAHGTDADVAADVIRPPAIVPAVGEEIDDDPTDTVITSPPVNRVVVPLLQGLFLEDALSKLDVVGLVPGDVTETDLVRATPCTVVAQDPAANSEADEGDPVDLEVNPGPVFVPSVLEMTGAAAIEELKSVGLDGQVLSNSDGGSEDGVVIRQDPAPLQPVDCGGTVDLLLAPDNDPAEES